MGKKKKEHIEFRYYEIPQNEWVIALTGKRWTKVYGRDVEGLHFHNVLEIGYCYGGTGDLIFESQSYRFKEEMISVIPEYLPHTTISDIDVPGTWEYLFIDMQGVLQEIYKETPLFAQKLIESINKSAIFIEVKENEKLAKLIKCIIEEAVDKKAFYAESTKGIVLALLLEVARINEHKELDNKVSVRSSLQIQNALDLVADKYYLPLKVEELSEVCHMSQTHFRRIFGEYMNMTPTEYINLIRIQKACEMLKKSNDSVRNIAIKVGYPTASTFDRNFKKIINMSPNEWRNSAENYEGKLLNYNISTLKGW